ncbi:MAG: hypothetical protein BWY82_00784 [Verrucomicrobia bacterium ADurb.Bin474]|nr:MAG: hypothetical protein BWY82_00784 [Verrucomicrobia bacterium ADurb.Bin474]
MHVLFSLLPVGLQCFGSYELGMPRIRIYPITAIFPCLASVSFYLRDGDQPDCMQPLSRCALLLVDWAIRMRISGVCESRCFSNP